MHTYENPRGFSIQFVFTKFIAKSTQLILYNPVSGHAKKPTFH